MSNTNQAEYLTKRGGDALSLVRLIFFVYGFALVLMAGFYVKRFGISLSTEHDHWGQFGDFFGGILNPLTSFFTLLVAILVWNLQRNELAATNFALQDQLRLSRITVADSVLNGYIASIQHHAETFHHREGHAGNLVNYFGDVAIGMSNTVLASKMGATDLSKISHASANEQTSKYYQSCVEKLAPLAHSVVVTCKYVQTTFSGELQEPRFDRVRISLSTQQMLAIILYSFLTGDAEAKKLMNEVDLLKYFPSCPQKDWFKTEAQVCS